MWTRVIISSALIFPDEKFTYQRHPMWDGSGKVVTKHVAMWSNLHDTSKPKFQVGIPADKRPSGKRPDSIVLRVTADARFSHAATWRKMATQKEKIYSSGLGSEELRRLLSTWCLILGLGSSKLGPLVLKQSSKGCCRVKKGTLLWALYLQAAGNFLRIKDFFLNPSIGLELRLKVGVSSLSSNGLIRNGMKVI